MADNNWMNHLGKASRGFHQLPAVRQLSLLLGLSISIALGFWIVLWSQSPDYRPLYSHLDTHSTAEVVDALGRAGVKYKVENSSGSVLVPSDKIYTARIRLAAAGLPKHQGMGFELLDKEQNIGVSRFMETARYWHALEGELSRTISSFSQIRSARVHLAIPKRTAFVSDHHKTSASVLIDLVGHQKLNKDTIDAIEQLVASSIQGLSPKNVTVVDETGRLLSDNDSGLMRQTRAEFSYRHTLESNLEHRIEDLISPMVGPNKVRAKVSADVDFTHKENTQETFNPENSVIRSEQSLNEKSSGTTQSSGAAGASSNTPAGGGGGGSQNTGKSNTKQQNTKNYEVSKNISHTSTPVGRVKKISVAVLVDDLTKTDPESGTVTRTKLTQPQLDQIKDLVKNAVGYNEKRGDSVSVVNSAFAEQEKIAAQPELPIWEQAFFWRIVKTVLGGLFVLLLVFMVLRPVLKHLAVKSEEAPSGPKPITADAAATITTGESGLDPNDQVVITAGELSRLQQKGQWNKLREMAAEDPRRIAQVMRTWVGDE